MMLNYIIQKRLPLTGGLVLRQFLEERKVQLEPDQLVRLVIFLDQCKGYE